jgi:outer membrane protein assembly factor BamB
VRPDPVVADTSVDAAKPPNAITRIIRGDDIIDLDRGVVVINVGKTRVSISDATDAYALMPDKTLRAFRLTDGSERWNRSARDVRDVLAQDDLNVYAIKEPDVIAIRKASGDVHPIRGSTVGIDRVEAFGGVVAVARRDKTVELYDQHTLSKTASLTLSNALAGWGAGIFPLADRATACAIVSTGKLEITCFAANGAARTSATATAGGSIVDVSERYALYGNIFFGPRTSTIVRLSDGKAFSVADQVSAFVERADGSLEGFVVAAPELRMLETTGAVRWKATKPKHWGESASAIARDGKLYVDVYSSASSGSSLDAYDLTTGAHLWTADVEQLPIAHSEYFNDVKLSFLGPDRILLRGDESSVVTTQAFNLTDGKRAWAISHHR